MAQVSIPLTNSFSARPHLAGKVRLPVTNKKPCLVTCRIGKIDSVKPKTFFGRTSFPPGFTFGAASSAYQVSLSISHIHKTHYIRMHMRHYLINLCRWKEELRMEGKDRAYGTPSLTLTQVSKPFFHMCHKFHGILKLQYQK